MEEQEAEKVTSVRSPSPMEQAVEEKHPADLTAPEVKEVACIIPEKVVGGSPVAQVRLHSQKPTDGDKVDDLEIAASRDELQTTSSAKGETVPGFEAAYIGAESNQLPSASDGSDALIWLLPDDGAEPHFMLLPEDEHAPTLEAVQAREEPHRSSCMDEGDILVSESFPLGVEHSAPVLVERGEASVPDVSSPPTNGMESALELAQPGAEPVIACAIGTDGIAEYGIEMAGDLAEATVNEFTEEVVDFAEEAVESAGEEVEVACSVDNASENEHSTVVDMKRRGGRKRKRGRPSSKLNGTRFPSQKKDEEEVCFICFDGGDLVVCDRRGCPKVYHPSCVNREEEYFRSKGQWSCGWHLCSKCHKSASYKCYTCTYSLCKLCINEEEFTCIRGNKGFCTACMTTILLMETSDNTQEKKDVDFNDRSCWEYLFKDYWLELKAKLSINLNELTNAGVASKMCGLDSGNEESSDDGQGASSDRSSACHDESIPSKNKLKITRNTYKITRKAVQTKGIPSPEVTSRKRTRIFSRNSVPESPKKEEKYEVSVRLENPLMIKEKKRCKKPASEVGTVNGDESKLAVHKNKPSRKKSKRRPRRTLEKNNSLDDKEEQTTAAENTDWASKELLEFVSHVKNGDDKSILSPYEVQELLLDYIKVNKLRDPRKKSQIICDAMLRRLFDKPRVGHFEMLKLLESHFHIKVSSPASDENQAGTDPIQVGAEISNVLDGSMITDKQRITRKIVESKEQTNLYCYAAIDLHNINMMYLRRYWMEDLIDDMSTFSEKVIGSFVRIRVTTSSQRQEVYRLVQVVGCGKAPEEYKTGRKTTDVMLEVINLDKKEAITIDIISNQDFTEEECKRLRQSIKFGFISRLTVGEVQEKARVLQAVRISDNLESEKLRLTHLRDRASEKGKKKEHRECVEKLHLLNSPEEQKKRLCDIAQAHADPKMDPGYESSDDDGDEEEIKKGNPGRPVHSTFKEKELISPQKEGYNLGGTPKSSNTIIASHNNGAHNNNSVETHIIEEKVEALLDNKAPERETTILPESKLEASLAQAVSPSIASENEKQWHYKDPSGKIQGPFSLVQLKKWSKHFPSNLAIWRKSERQEDSILLTDALAGNLQKDLPEWLPLNAVSLNSPSLSVISSSKIQETSILVQNEKVVGNASCSDSVTNSDIKRNKGSADFYKVSGSEQVAVARAVNTESIQQASYQLTDVHNRTQVISSELDPRKKILEDPGTTHGNGDAIQKQDFSGHHNSNSCSNHGKDPQTDKVADHSTSSTESNNVPEASQPDQTSASFPKSGDSNPSPIIESKALVSSSPQRSDHSTYPMRGPQTQSAHPNSSTQTSNNFPNPVNVPPSQPPPQTFVPSNWNQPLNAIAGDQSVSPSMISTVSSGVSTSVNCQSTPLVSSDSSMQPFSSSQMNHSSMQPFSSSQMNHNMNPVNYQQANMIWDGNNPVWQVQNQYQNLSHMAAAVGNILYGNTNPGWGMMAQGNMTMPWVVPPNANMVWNQAIPMPPQGTAAPNFIQQPPQGNIPSYPVWNAPVQPNANQNPAWAPPVLANTGQVTHENTTMPRGLSNENQSGSSMQMERGSGQRDGGFRGGVPGYGPGRQPRGWMGGGNGGRSSRHQEFDGVCVFHHRYGHCKKGTSCNYSHS